MKLLLRIVYPSLALLACAQPRETPVAQSSGADWTRGAVCYEIFVRSFSDSNGDGIGDLNGLTARLDYVNDGSPATARTRAAAHTNAGIEHLLRK